MANPSEEVPQASVPVPEPEPGRMRVGLLVYLPQPFYEAAKRDGAVQAALDAFEDPVVDLEKWELYSSIHGAVWMLQQHSDANVYTLCIGPSRTGGTWL